MIGYHRLDTNSSSAAFLYGGCVEYNGWSYKTTQGIFQYTQDDTLVFGRTGSRTN